MATYRQEYTVLAEAIVTRSTSGRLLPARARLCRLACPRTGSLARARTGRKKAESTIITVLPTSDGTHYVVTSGLAVGDVIVAKGAGYVKEGQEIEVRPKKTATTDGL